MLRSLVLLVATILLADPAGSQTAPGTVFHDCPDCPEMVVVPAGSFMMGSNPAEITALEKQYPKKLYLSDYYRREGPQHKVTIARPFAIGRYEVTFAEWDACVAAGGCKHNPSDQGWGRGKLPVVDVSWDNITNEYLPWLSRKTGKTYRLPSEAEWEYAARAGTTTPFWWGSSISTSQANYDGRGTYGRGPRGEYRQKTVPVDSFAPNPWGLFNVHGNVMEWVQDCLSNVDYRGAPTDGSAWTTAGAKPGTTLECVQRGLRGGFWGGEPRGLRSASRHWDMPDMQDLPNAGFRLARTLDP
jgi:formylglycine-generating enzyme required for sulfatase activity